MTSPALARADWLWPAASVILSGLSMGSTIVVLERVREAPAAGRPAPGAPDEVAA